MNHINRLRKLANTKPHRKHTPIVSRQQQKLFAVELRRRKMGEIPQMQGITNKELKEHLEESREKSSPQPTTESRVKRSMVKEKAFHKSFKGN